MRLERGQRPTVHRTMESHGRILSKVVEGDELQFTSSLRGRLDCSVQAGPKRDRVEAGTAVIAAAVGRRRPWSRQGQQRPGPGPILAVSLLQRQSVCPSPFCLGVLALPLSA